MSCVRLARTNNNQSILFDKLYEIVNDEQQADELFAYFDEPSFIEAFGDYKNVDLDSERLDDNGEPALFLDNKLNKYYFRDKYNEKVFYPYANTGLNQHMETNDIRTFAKSIALNFYKDHIDFDYDNLSFKMDKSIVDFTKNFLDAKIDELTNSPKLEHLMKGLALQNTQDNLKDWVTEVKDYFATLKTNYNFVDEAFEQTEEDETTRDDLMRKESFTVSQKDNINNNIKLFLSLIQNNERNDFNEYTFIPFDDIYSTLNKTLNNKVAIYENGENLFDVYKEEIKNLINVKPYFQVLYDRLNNSEITDAFKNQFVSAFNLYKKNYLVSEIYRDTNGNVFYDVKNLTDGGSRKRNYMDNWNFTFNNIVKDSPKYINQEIKKLAREFNKNYNKISDIKPYIKDLEKALQMMGVSYTDNAFNYLRNGMNLTDTNSLEEDKQFIKRAYSQIERTLKYSANNPTANPFEYQNLFRDLAESMAFFQEDGTDASVFTMGKTKWFYSTPSYIDFKIEEWKKNPKALIDHYESTVYNNGSHWLEYLTAAEIDNMDKRIETSRERLSQIKVAVFNNVQTKNDSINGFDNKNIPYTDALVDYMNKVLAFKKDNDAYHKTALAADKATEYQLHFGNNPEYFTLSSNLLFEDGKFKINDDVLNIMYKYFKSEYDRINEVYNEIQEGENLIPNYHTGRANGLKSQLIPSLSDNSVIKLYDTQGKPLYQDLNQIKDNIKNHINDVLNDLIIQHYNLLLDNQVFVYNEEGQRVNQLLDNNIYETYKANVANKNQIFHNVAADFLINSIVSQVEYSKMFTGDIAYYKDMADYKKRVPETYTDGKYLLNLKQDELTFNAAIINGVEIAYQDMESLKEYLDEDIYKFYEDNINDTDAQAWITPERWLFIMDKLGKKNDRVDNLYRKITSGKKEIYDSTELKLLAQPLKGVYFDITQGKPVYLKYSQAVLLPNLIKGTKLETIYNKMKDANVDELVTRDGIKVGYPIPITTHNENGTVRDDFDLTNSIVRLNNSKWKLQQDLPTKGIKSTAVGSQIQKNIYQGLIHGNLDKEFYIGNETYKGSELIEQINDVVNALSTMGMNNVKTKLGIDDNFIIQNEDKLYDGIITQLKKRTDANPNIIKALEAGTSPYGIPSGLQIFQNVFSTIVNKNIVKISTNGGGYIQMANYGLSKENAEKQNIIYTPWHDKNHLPMPELYTDENGKKRLKPAGIFLSGSFLAKAIPNYKNIPSDKLFGTADNNYEDGIIDRKILENIIGYRIPNQGLASNDALQVLGILPEEIGDTVIVYTGITKKTGSDFDIDKMYLMTPSFSIENETYVKVDKYVNDNLRGNTIKDTIDNVLDLLDKIDPTDELINTNIQQLSELIFKSPSELSDLNDIRLFYMEELAAAIYEYKGQDTELVKLRNQLVKSRPSKLRYSEYDSSKPSSEQHPKMLQNRLIELYQSVLTSVHTANDTFNPIDLDVIENDIKSLLPVEETKDFEDLNAIADLKLKNEFILGKAGLGQNVNSLVDSVRGAMAELKFNGEDYFIGTGLVNEEGETIFDSEFSEVLSEQEIKQYVKTYNEKAVKIGKPLLDIKDAQKDLASIKLNTAMMTLVNGFVDIAKDPYITKGNWVTQTNNVGFMMLRAGTHPFKINAFLNQPFIKDFIKFRANMESNAIKNTSNLFSKFLLSKVYDNVNREMGQETTTINGLTYSFNNIFKSILTNDTIVSNHNAIMRGDDNTKQYNSLIKKIKGKLVRKFDLTDAKLKDNNQLKAELNQLFDTIMEYHDDIFKKVGKKPNALNLTTMRNEILDESNNENQLYYLRHFNNLNSQAKILSKNVTASKVDVDGKGKNITSLITTNNKIKNIISNEKKPGALGGFSDKLYWNGQPTILKTYIDNSIGFPYQVMKSNPKYFLTANESVIKTFNVISQFIYDQHLENDKLADLLEKTYNTYTISGFPALYTTRKEKADLLNDTPDLVKELKKKYPDNKLLQELYINTGKELSFAGMSNVKKSLQYKNDLIDAWRNLLEIDQESGEKLIKYSFIISGFNNTINQFHEYIPYEWFNKNRFNSYLIENTIRLKDIDYNFINQFFRNNLNDLSLSTQVFDNQLAVKNHNVVTVKKESISTDTNPYLIRRNIINENTGKGKLYFYKLEGETAYDTILYTRVTPLGYKDNSNNRFVEYNNTIPYKNSVPLLTINVVNRILNLDKEEIANLREVFDPSEESIMIPEAISEEVVPPVPEDDNINSFINTEVIDNYDVELVKSNPDKIYIFGDNMLKKGKKGQAIIRDEKNSFGIRTKALPSTTDDSYWSDSTIEQNKRLINEDIEAIKSDNRIVVFPKNGLGTGLAKLKEKAPQTYEYLKQRLLEEFNFNNDTGEIINDIEDDIINIESITDENSNDILNLNPISNFDYIDNSKIYYETSNYNLFNGGTAKTSRDVLANLISSGSLNDNQKKLAELLLKSSDAKVRLATIPLEFLMGYSTKENTIFIDKKRFETHNPETIINGFMHEAIHNVLYGTINNPINIDEKLFVRKINRAFNKFNTLYSQSNEKVAKQVSYGLKNTQEFVAEITTNPEFRQLLDKLETNEKKSIWKQIVDAIKSLFGIKTKVDVNDIIQDIMDLTEKGYNRKDSSDLILAKIANDDLLVNLETTKDKYTNAISRIKESLNYNINNFTNVSNRVRYYDEVAADNWDKYIKSLRDIRRAIEDYQDVEPADSLSYFLDAMDASLNQITSRLDNINYENIDDAIKTYEIYSGYLDTYNVIDEVGKLLAHMKENKEDNDILSEQDIKDLEARLDFAGIHYKKLVNRFQAVRGKILTEALNNPLYFPNVLTEHKKKLNKEYNQKGLSVDKESWISDKIYNRDREEIDEKVKDEIAKLINNPAFDIYGSDVKMSSVINISSPLLQIMNQIITNIKNNRTVIERSKDKEFETLFNKLVEEKGTNNITKLYKNILDKDKNGKYYIKGNHSIKLLDAIKKFRLNEYDIRAKISDLDVKLNDVRQNQGINSDAYKEALKEKKSLRNKLKSDKAKFLENNFKLDDKNQVIEPLSKWETDLSGLTDIEQQVLKFFQDMTEENNQFYHGKESLVKYQFKTRFYELPKITKSDAERVWTGNITGIVEDKYKDLTRVRPDDYGYTTQYTDLAGEKVNRLKVHFRDTSDRFANKDQSLDLMTIMRLDYQAANAYRIRKDSEPILKMLVDLAGSKQYYEMTGTKKIRSSSTKKFNLKDGSTSNTYQFAMNMLETKFYDQLHKNNVKLGKIDANKAVGFFNNATAFMTLSLNIASGTANVINAQAQLFLESFIKGNYIKASSIAKANALYSEHMLDTLQDVTNPINKSYINQINEMFDVEGLFFLTEASFLKSDIIKKGVNWESLQVLQNSGEHYIQSIVTMSVLDGIKAMNADHKFINKKGEVVEDSKKAASVLDMLVKDDAGLVNLDSNVVYTSHSNLVKWNEGGKSQVDTLVDKKIKDSIGNYKKMDQPELMRHWYGKLVLLFRKYFVSMGQARLRGIEYAFIPSNELTPDQRRYSYALQEYEEGTYVSLLRYISTALKQKKASLLMTNWKELSDYEKVNIKRSVTELVSTMVVLPLLVMLAKTAADGDDDQGLFFLAYQLRRLETELSAYMSPSENLKMLRSPIPSTRILETGLGVFGALLTPWNLGDVYETGPNKGDNKFITRAKRKIPVVKEFNRQYETLFNFQDRPGGGFGY